MRRLFPLAALSVLSLAACEAIIGADFDPKQLASVGGAGGSGAAGGSSVMGGSGGGEEKLANGSPCTDPESCASAICSEGVCCDAPCDGECRSCILSGSEGSCTALPLGAPCPETPNGSCDGVAFCATGAHLWSVRFGGTGLQAASACDFAPNGELWVAGNFAEAVDFGSPQDSYAANFIEQRIFALRFDEGGDVVWSSAIGNDDPASTRFELDDLAVNDDGHATLVGHVDGTISVGGATISGGTNGDTVFALAIDPAGQPLWHHEYEGQSLSAQGDQGQLRVAAGPGGRFAVTASYAGWVDLDDGAGTQTAQGLAAGFLVEHDAGGAILSSWILDGPEAPAVYTRDVAYLATGELFIMGQFHDGSFDIADATIPWIWNNQTVAGLDGFAVTLQQGSAIWANRYGDLGNESFVDAAATPDGGFAFGGTFSGDVDFGGGLVANQSSSPGVMTDFFVAKLSAADATDVWPAKGIGPTQTIALTGILRVAADGAGNVVTSGLTFDGMQIDGTPIPNVTDGSFLAKLNRDGELLWVQAFGVQDTHPLPSSGRRLQISDVAAHADGRIAICGYTTDTVSFGGDDLASADGRDIVVAVFRP